MKIIQVLALTLPGVLLGCAANRADADEKAKNASAAKRQEVEKVRHADDKRVEAEKARAADDTGKNKRDQDDKRVTADQQSNKKSDIELTAEIRRMITDTKDLSINAQNIKIITTDGKVVLRGPVKSSAEKLAVEQKAIQVAGKSHVKSEIEIAQ